MLQKTIFFLEIYLACHVGSLFYSNILEMTTHTEIENLNVLN